MRILIVAATEAEIGPLIKNQGSRIESPDDFKFQIKNPESDTMQSISSRPSPKGEKEENSLVTYAPSHVSYLITGVGMVATAFALGGRLAANKYDLVINLGIAGSFDRTIALGEVAEIIEDTFTELGAEDDEDFIPLNDLSFGDVTFMPERHPFLNIKQVRAITVNKVHGNNSSIREILERLNPQLESMEGAAVFYACRQAGVPCVQIRAVSNYVERRNRDAWQIGLAVRNLNTFAVELLDILHNK